MANLKYYVYLEEHLVNKAGNTLRIYERSLPHHAQIAVWLPKEWEKANPAQHFPEELKEIIESCEMKVYQDPKLRTAVCITVRPKPRVFWSKRTRAMAYEELDKQFSDGFGETYSHSKIPGVPDICEIGF